MASFARDYASTDRMPRMDFTGERFITGHGSSELFHEHVHRYQLAAALADGAWVVDVGSGDGYGAVMLMRAGVSRVVGIDVDAEAVDHASATYAGEALAFVASPAEATGLPDAQADLVTCFEVIEHVTEPAGVVREIARLLAPGGVALISTPETVAHQEIIHADNPFHLSEMTEAEFRAALEPSFAHIVMLGRRSLVASWVGPLGDGGPLPMLDARGSTEEIRPTCLIAACSHSPVSRYLLGRGSVLIDPGEQERQERQDLATQTAGARVQLASYENDIQQLAEALRNADAELQRLRGRGSPPA